MNELTVKISKQRALTEVELAGRMTIDQVTKLKVALLTAFERGKGVRVKLAGVIEADLSGLQVLCSAHRLSTAQQRGFSLSGRDNGVIVATARSAGLLRTAGCIQDVDNSCVWKYGSE